MFYGYWRVGRRPARQLAERAVREAFAGAIDEVAIYNKALTLAQVQANYNASGRTARPAAPEPAADGGVHLDRVGPEGDLRRLHVHRSGERRRSPTGGTSVTASAARA